MKNVLIALAALLIALPVLAFPAPYGQMNSSDNDAINCQQEELIDLMRSRLELLLKDLGEEMVVLLTTPEDLYKGDTIVARFIGSELDGVVLDTTTAGVGPAQDNHDVDKLSSTQVILRTTIIEFEDIGVVRIYFSLVDSAGISDRARTVRVEIPDLIQELKD